MVIRVVAQRRAWPDNLGEYRLCGGALVIRVLVGPGVGGDGAVHEDPVLLEGLRDVLSQRLSTRRMGGVAVSCARRSSS